MSPTGHSNEKFLYGGGTVVTTTWPYSVPYNVINGLKNMSFKKKLFFALKGYQENIRASRQNIIFSPVYL